MTAPEPSVSLTEAHQWALDAAVVEETTTSPVEALLAFRIRRLATTLDNFMLALQEQERSYQADLRSAAEQVKAADARAKKAEELLRRVLPELSPGPLIGGGRRRNPALAREIEDALAK